MCVAGAAFCMPPGAVVEVVESVVPTLLGAHGLSPQGSSVHGVSQGRILEWVAISFSTPWCIDQALFASPIQLSAGSNFHPHNFLLPAALLLVGIFLRGGCWQHSLSHSASAGPDHPQGSSQQACTVVSGE